MVLQSISPTSQNKFTVNTVVSYGTHLVDHLPNSVTSEWKLVERVLCHELGNPYFDPGSAVNL